MTIQPEDQNLSAEAANVKIEAWPIVNLKENIHYYLEDGLMVFTAAYHRARGTCCGNACRHCPFEHVNVR